MAESSASMPVMTAWLVMERLEHFGGPGERSLEAKIASIRLPFAATASLTSFLASAGDHLGTYVQNHVEVAAFDQRLDVFHGSIIQERRVEVVHVAFEDNDVPVLDFFSQMLPHVLPDLIAVVPDEKVDAAPITARARNHFGVLLFGVHQDIVDLAGVARRDDQNVDTVGEHFKALLGLCFGAVRQAEPQFDVRSEGFGAFLHERHVLLPARRASGTDGNADFYLAAAVLATAQA